MTFYLKESGTSIYKNVTKYRGLLELSVIN